MAFEYHTLNTVIKKLTNKPFMPLTSDYSVLRYMHYLSQLYCDCVSKCRLTSLD